MVYGSLRCIRRSHRRAINGPPMLPGAGPVCSVRPSPSPGTLTGERIERHLPNDCTERAHAERARAGEITVRDRENIHETGPQAPTPHLIKPRRRPRKLAAGPCPLALSMV